VSLPDAELIARVLARDDRHAFSELVRRHQSSVRGFLRRLTRGRQALADDLAQETFIEAYRSLARYRGHSAFSTWLLGIACNRWRNDRRRERPTEEWTDDTVPAESVGGGDRFAADATTAADWREDLAAALVHLSDGERAAIHLCFQEGLTNEEAAEVLGFPLGTVKTHLARAKEKLRAHLQAWAPS
jgi:RNA polymerase sigma-70 factor (ECF subfamily)